MKYKTAQRKINKNTNQMDGDKQILSVSEAAAILKVSPTSLRRLEQEGRIKSIRQPNGYRLFSKIEVLKLKQEIDNTKNDKDLKNVSLSNLEKLNANKEYVKTNEDFVNILPSKLNQEKTRKHILISLPVLPKINWNKGTINEIRSLKKPIIYGGILALLLLGTVRVSTLTFGNDILGKFSVEKIVNLVKSNESKIALGNVLATKDYNSNIIFKVNVPSIFKKDITAEQNVSVNGNLNVTGLSTLAGGLTTNNEDGDFGTGTITVGVINFVGTSTINNLAAIDEVTESTLEEALDINGDVVSTGLNDTVVARINGAELGNTEAIDNNILMAIGNQWTSVSQTEITSLGTITQGVWQGDPIAPEYGGLGIDTFVTGDMIFADTNTTWAAMNIGGTGYILSSNGTIPQWVPPSALVGDSWLLSGNTGTSPNLDFIGTSDNVGLSFRTNNVDRLRITEAGFVGIGNTDPAVDLHLGNGNLAPTYVSGVPESQFIEGDLEVAGTIYGSLIGVITTTGFDPYGLFFADNAGTLTNDNTEITWNPTTNSFTVNGVSTFNGLAQLSDGLSVTGPSNFSGLVRLGNGTNTIDLSSTVMSFDDTNLSSALTLTTSDTLFTSGDTGIVDAINAAYEAATGGGDGLWSVLPGVIYPSNSVQDLAVGGSDPSAPFYFDTTTNLLTLTNSTGGNSFRVNDQVSDLSPFVIDTDGNVGIGTTTPAYKLDVVGDIRINSGSDYYIGLIGLNDTGTNNLTSGASQLGVFDEFTYSASTTIQAVLNDLDAQLSATVGGSHPAVQLTGTPSYLTFDDAAQILTMHAINISTAANVTGVLSTTNGGLGFNASTAASGALLLGNGTGLQSRAMNGDATIDQNGTLTLATVNANTGSYGSGLWIPVLNLDGKGRILSANTAFANFESPLTFNGALVRSGTAVSLDVLTTSTTSTTASNSGLEIGADGLRLLGGCASNEVMSWDSGANRWKCASISGVGAVTGTGVNGQISFWSGTSTLAGSGNFYWDNPLGRLGIGNSNPAQALDVTGSIAASANVIVGGTALSSTLSNRGSGAFMVGAYDEFTYSSSTNVQGVLRDLDSQIGTVISGTHPSLQLAGTANYLTLNGSQVLTQNAIDLATATNVTGILPTLNGGLGFNASTAASGSLLLGNGTGFNSRSMNGDATIDLNGTLSLVGTGVTAGTYGSALGIPVITVDSKGRITAAATSSLSNLLDGTGINNYIARFSDYNTLTTGTLYDNGSQVGLGTTNPSQSLDVSGAIRLGVAGLNNVLNTSASGGAPTGNLFWGDRILTDSSNISNYAITSFSAGNGLTLVGTGPGAVALSLDVTTAGTTGTTASNSGLEIASDGLRLLGGCGLNEVLSWDAGANRWQCSTISGVGGLTGTGANGQIAFWTGVSTQSGSDNFFWDNGNGYLGIGKTNPLQAIDVVGSIALSNNLIIGGTALSSTLSNAGSGAYMIGTFDEFTNSNATNVQAVLNDLDATFVNYALASNTHPAMQLAGTPSYLSFNAGSQILTMNMIDISTAANITGILPTFNGGLGFRADTAPAGSLVFGNGSGLQSRIMNGDATIDQNGTLTLANVNTDVGTYGSSYVIPVLNIDAKGRILSATTVIGIFESPLVFDNPLIRVGTGVSLDVLTTGTTGSTASNSGLEIGSDGLRLLGGCGTNEVLAWDSGANRWVCSSVSGVGGVTGTGLVNYVARWTGTSTLSTGALYDNGSLVGIGQTNPQYALDVTGDIRGTNLRATTNLIIGGTALSATLSNAGSGAYMIGAFDEFDNSNSTNVQAVLNDLDATFINYALASNTHPAMQLVGTPSYLSFNAGSQVLTMNMIDISTAANITGILPTFNGGLGFRADTAPAGSLVFGNGTGLQSRAMNGDATIDQNGTLTLATVNANTGSYGSGLWIPVLNLDGKGRILSANTAFANFESPLTFNTGLLRSGTAISLDVTTTGITSTTASNSGLEIGSDGLRLLGGCALNEVLAWDAGANRWQCSTVSGVGGVTGTGIANYSTRWTGTSTLSTGALYDNGLQIGLGTTNPTDDFHIVGNSNPGISITNSAYGITGRLFNDGNVHLTGGGNLWLDGGPIYLNGGNTNFVSIGSTAGSAKLDIKGWGTTDALALAVKDSNSVYNFVVQDNGSVGIGTSNPSQALDVVGSIALSNNLIIGGTALSATLSNAGSGAYMIGTFDEFDNSNSTNVQGVLNDLDANFVNYALASNTHPAMQLAGTPSYLSFNSGSQVLTMNMIDISTAANITGILPTFNGGLGFRANTAPAGSLILGNGTGLQSRAMNGDATIDQNGTLTLNTIYGIGLIKSGTAVSLDVTTTGTTGTTASNSGLEIGSDGLRLIGGCSTNEVLSWDSGANRWRCSSVSGVGGVTGSGAAGQVSFWSSTSNLTGTDAFFWNSLNGRLGLGTTNPDSTLTITPSSAAAFQINPFGTNAGNTGEFRLTELVANGANYTGFKSPDNLTQDIVYTLPASTSPADYVLTYQSGGALQWKEITGVGAAGDITQVGSMTTAAVFADAGADDQWLGLGAAGGRIEFDELGAIDEVNIQDANVGIGTTTPAYTLDVNGDVRGVNLRATTALIVGGTSIASAGVNNVTSGASLIGVFDEFAYSDSPTVQGVLNDLDAQLGTLGAGTTHPALQLAGTASYLSLNGTQVLTQFAIDISTAANITGVLPTFNGGLGFRANTAPAGSLIFGNGTGLQSRAMNGDATIDQNGTLTLATVNSNTGSYGSGLWIPILNIDAKGRILSANTAFANFESPLVFGTGLLRSGTAISLDVTTTGTTSTTASNSGLEIGSDGLRMLGGCGANQVLAWDAGANRWNCSTPTTGTGVAGRVTFWDGTTSIASSQNFYWDNSLGRLGIGNSNPSQALDVTGSIAASTNLIVGGTALSSTLSNAGSGAYMIGTFDEFDNSNSTNVQAVLNDLDANFVNYALASNTHPAMQLAGSPSYLSFNSGTQVLTMNMIDISTAANITGILPAFNGGLGFRANTAPAGSLIFGNGTGLQSRVMNGDATIDSNGTLTLANTGVSAATYGSALGIPVLNIDSKGRIISASTASIVNMLDGTGIQNYVARFTDNNTLSTGIAYDTGSLFGIGTTNPLEVLHVSNNYGFLRFGDNNSAVQTSNAGMLFYSDYSNTELGRMGFFGDGSLYIQNSMANRSISLQPGTGSGVGIGTTMPLGYFDISSGGSGLVVGADNNSYVRTNGVDKVARILVPNANNAEEPQVMLFATGGLLNVGGGTGSFNATNGIRFYTANDNTTLSGTEKLRITGNGLVGIANTNPQYTLDVTGSIAASTNLIVGGTALSATLSNRGSGAFMIGAFDEFDNSNSTNVQAVLNDLDATFINYALASNTHPAMQLVGTPSYLSFNAGSQVLTMNMIDISTAANITGILPTFNGGLGFRSDTAPAGSLVFGNGTGLQSRLMNGDATIDQNGTLTLATVNANTGSYGSGLWIPVLNLDGKGRILSANTAFANFESPLTFANPIIRSGTAISLDVLTTGTTGTTASNSGLEIGSDGLRLLGGCSANQVLGWDAGANRWNCITTSSGLGGTGVAGRITFWDSPTSVASSQNLYWDNTLGRLGIGNSNPSQALDVTGSIAASTNLIVGGTALSSTLSNRGSGAFMIGAFDEFTYSSNTNVQGVLRDLDAQLGTIVGGTHPAMQLAGTPSYLSFNTGSQVLTMNMIDISTAANITGILPTFNGGLGFRANTSPAGSLVFGNGTGLQSRAMNGDATIDQNGTLTLATVNANTGSYGSGLWIPVLNLDGKGRILSANTAFANFESPLTFANPIIRSGTAVSLDVLTTGTTSITASNSGLEIGSDGLRLLGGCSATQVLSWDAGANRWSCYSIPAGGNITGTGVNGRVAFFDSATNIATSQNLYWDNSLGRLGIGNSNPSQALDVTGSIAASTNLIVGGTALSSTLSNAGSGAFMIGAFDEFTNSNSTNVQGVLRDLDATFLNYALASNTHPAMQLAGTPSYLSFNAGSQVLTMNMIDISTAANITGILPTFNGGLGFRANTAPAGSLVFGNGTGLQSRLMNGDATIDQNGTLTLATVNTNVGTIGSAYGVPVLNLDAKGRILSATTAALLNIIDGTGVTNYLARFSDNNTLTTGVLYDNGSRVGLGTVNPNAFLAIDQQNLSGTSQGISLLMTSTAPGGTLTGMSIYTTNNGTGAIGGTGLLVRMNNQNNSATAKTINTFYGADLGANIVGDNTTATDHIGTLTKASFGSSMANSRAINMMGLKSFLNLGSGQVSVDSGYGINIGAPTNSGALTGSLGRLYGLYVTNQTVAGISFSDTYNIFSEGTTKNYFGGYVGIGTSTPGSALDVIGNIAASTNIIVGGTALSSTLSNAGSGAYMIGTFDEFDYSNSTNVQGVLNDLDANFVNYSLASNTHPAMQLAGTPSYLSFNAGSQVLTMNMIDISTAANITGILPTFNGGLGFRADTAPTGALILGNGTGLQSRLMNGDATIDQNGTLTLATVNSNTGSYGSSLMIPVLNLDGKGRILSASTILGAFESPLTFSNPLIRSGTAVSLDVTTTATTSTTASNSGIEIGSDGLRLLGGCSADQVLRWDAGANRWNCSSTTSGTIAGTGVAGRVTFWDGANTVASSQNFYWDNTLGRLGIGNSTPGQALDVTGSIAASTNLIVGGTALSSTLSNSGSGAFMIGTFDEFDNSNSTNVQAVLNDLDATFINYALASNTHPATQLAGTPSYLSFNAGSQILTMNMIDISTAANITGILPSFNGGLGFRADTAPAGSLIFGNGTGLQSRAMNGDATIDANGTLTLATVNANTGSYGSGLWIPILNLDGKGRILSANTALANFESPLTFANPIIRSGTAVSLDVITTATTSTTASNSGLEIGSDGLRLLGGCSANQLLTWDAGANRWQCTTAPSSSLFTDGGGTTYLTSTTDSFALGGTTASDAPFYYSIPNQQLILSSTGSADIFRINDSASDLTPFLVNASGFVGIGNTNPLASLHVINTTEQLRLGYDATNYSSFTVGSNGDITFAVNGTNAARFGSANNEFYLPTTFSAAGDVSFAYDAVFTNQTSSKISSYGPFTIEAGEAFENNNLTLKTYGTGNVIADLMGAGNFVLTGGTQATAIIFDTRAAGDSDFWAGVLNNNDATDNDVFVIGDGSIAGTNNFFSINTNGFVGIGNTNAAYNLDISGNLRATTAALGQINLGGESVGDFQGQGLVVSGTALQVRLTTASAGSSTASNSGLELSASGLRMLGGCATNEVLSWDSGANRWRCTTLAGIGSLTGTGVAGRVTFWDGVSSLVSSQNLYWDNAQGRLGIGNSNPSQALDVTGSIAASTNFIVGGTALSSTLSNKGSGAYMIGAFDEFTYSSNTNVQAVLKDLDTQLTTLAGGTGSHPAVSLTGTPSYLSLDSGTQVLTMNMIDISTAANITGILPTFNGGLGFRANTAPAGSLIFGNGTGLQSRAMNGDATIDQNGTLTLATVNANTGSYGSGLWIPVLNLDGKGRILSANTAFANFESPLTFNGALVRSGTAVSLDVLTTSTTSTTASNSGLEIGADGLRLLGGCSANQILSWDAGANRWNCSSVSGVGGVTGTGLNNYVARWNGTSTLNVGTLYDDGTNIGIGTTDPNDSIYVSGAGTLGLTLDRSGVVGRLYNDGNVHLNGGGNLWLDGGNIYLNSGNTYEVAIGSSSTNATLDVKGNGTGTGLIFATKDSSDVYKFAIQDDGSVGIGKTNPAYALDVVGSIAASSNVIVGGTALSSSLSNAGSGAYMLGAFDEFDNSNSTNVQAVLNDLDSAFLNYALASNTHPAMQLAGAPSYLSLNTGSQILTMNMIDISTAANITGILPTFNGGLGFRANTAPAGSLIFGNGSGLQSRIMNGDATIDQNGTLTLNAFYGIGLLKSGTALSLDVLTTGVTTTTASNSGLEIGADGLRLLGGCSANQILSWDAGANRWQCTTAPSGSLFTDGGGTTYLTSLSDSFAIGGTTASDAPFYYSVPNQALTLTSTGSADIFRINDAAGDLTPFLVNASGFVGIGNTNPLASLHVINTTEQLRLGYDATNYSSFTIGTNGDMTLSVNGTNSARFGSTNNEFYLPTTFSAAGDVSFAYDALFANQTASFIKSSGPLTIENGDSYESNNLTLKTFNAGNIVLDLGSSLMLSNTSPSMIFDSTTGSNTDFWAGVVTNANGTSDDIFSIGSGSTVGSNRALNLNSAGMLAIGYTNASYVLDVLGNIRGTTAALGQINMGGESVGDFQGQGLVVSGTALQVRLTTASAGSSTASNSGLELSASGIRMIGGCSDNQVLAWSAAHLAWECTTGASSGLFTDGGGTTYLTSVSDSFAIGGTTASDAPFFFSVPNQALTLTSTGTADIFRINDGAGDLTPFLVDADGQVGIGNTNPVAGLHVIGTTEQLRLGYSATQYSSFTVSSNGDLTLSTNGTNSARFGAANNEFYVPTTFSAAGDVSFSYDAVFTNQTSSQIESYGPFSVIAGENYESNDLTLKTYNSGDVVMDLGRAMVMTNSAPGQVFDIMTTGDTDFWMGVFSTNNGLVNDDWLSIGTGSTLGSNRVLSIDNRGFVGIGVTTPSAYLDLIASTTAAASMRMRTGSQPTNPATGDMYADGSNVYYYNGATWDGLVGGGASNFTDGGGTTYLTSLSDSFALGGTTASDAPFFFSVPNSSLTLSSLGSADIFRVNDESTDLTPFIINASGNVGIGTTNATAKLTVAGTAGTNSTISNNSGPIGIMPQSGNVGIGTTNPSVALHVVGNARFTNVGSGAFSSDINITSDGTLTTSASDIRLKTNVEEMTSVLEKVLQLNPVTYNWKTDENGRKDIGLIAQEAAVVFPEITFVNQTDGFMGVNYSRLGTILVAAMQEMNMKVDALSGDMVGAETLLAGTTTPVADLQTTVNNLTGDVAGVKDEITSLKDQVASLKELINGNTNETSESTSSITEEIISEEIVETTQSTQSTSSIATILAPADMLTGMQTIFDNFVNLFESFNLTATPEDGLLVNSDLTVVGDATFNNVTITGDLMAGLIKVDTLENSIDVMGPACYNKDTGLMNTENCQAQTLYLQKDLAGNVNIFDGAVVIEPNGTLTVNGSIKANTITAEEFQVKGASKLIGSGTIKAGTKEIVIDSDKVKANSKVFVTATTQTGGQSLIVINKIEGESFTVAIETTTASDVNFDWWILNVE